MTTADNAPEVEELPAGQEAPPAPEDSGPETEADAREREIQRRLTQQGRELAAARRQAEVAQAAAQASATQVDEMRTTLQRLSTNLNERDKRDQAAAQRALEAELASLPPADRLQRQIEILQGQITNIQQQRTAAPQAQPARQQAAPAPQTAQTTDEERRAYMEKRVQEIVAEAERAYGVRPNLDTIPDADWDTEETFTRSVMQQAQAGGTVASKKDETPAQMRERIRQEEREKLGATSPAAPRAAGTGGRRKAASEADVRAAVQGYDSKLGPKANVERMKKLRESMG